MRKALLCCLLVFAVLCGCQSNKPCTEHADENEDLLCDLCDESVVVVLDFYAVNDLHGKLVDGDNQPGVDEMTTYFRAMQAGDDHAILLSVGDMWQGSPESNLTNGLIITDWMNDVGFACMTLGNHEFDWGEEVIKENLAAADFPFLAINIYDRETNRRVDYCQASVVIDCGSVQVGVIGAIGDCYSSILAEKVQDVYFKTGNELTAMVKAESQRLRSEGVDIVVYSLHDGWDTTGNGCFTEDELASYYDLSLSNGYVDLVFEGHTHQKYLAPDTHGVYHLQHRGDNTGGISHVELSYNTVTEEVSVLYAELVSGIYRDLPDDPIVDQLLQKYQDRISYADKVLGTNAKFRDRNELRQLIADLYLRAGLEKWGGEYDIALGGGFISIRSPGQLTQGEVTYGMLQSLFPFDNELVLCSIRGRDLLDRFINTGNDNYFISRANNAAIDPSATYYIIVDTYTSSYAPNRLTEIARYGADIFARDMLAELIRQGGLS